MDYTSGSCFSICYHEMVDKRRKLTELQVKQIKLDYSKSSNSYWSLSVKYGVSYWAIRDIIKGKTWKKI